MKNDEIIWFNLNKGIPTATIAKYGISLNQTAVDLTRNFKFAVIGYEKRNNIVVFRLSNDENPPEGGFNIMEKVSKHGYLRLNNKDLVRLISKYADIDLNKPSKYIVEFDGEGNRLLIDLTKELESEKSSNN